MDATQSLNKQIEEEMGDPILKIQIMERIF